MSLPYNYTLQFPGMTDFLFTMTELQAAIDAAIPPEKPVPASHRRLDSKEVYVESLVYDWFWKQYATGSGITVIYGKAVDLVLLGDRSRTFKPNRTMDVYVSGITINICNELFMA